MNDKDKDLLLDYLSQYRLMSLATVDKNGEPWSAVVYYLFDNGLNFFFLSPTDTLHCNNIKDDQNVSFTIAKCGQKASDKKIGLQVRGKAEKVKGTENIKAVIKMWNSLHDDVPPITFKKLMKVWSSRFYKITPSYIKWFNEELYGEDGEKVWKL